MKNYLFLSFLSLSTFSIGQTQETTVQKSVDPQPIQQQRISKINKIDKRVQPVRSKEVEAPVRKVEAIKPN